MTKHADRPSADQPPPSPRPQPNNPLHGVTLEVMLTALVAHNGWEGLPPVTALTRHQKRA